MRYELLKALHAERLLKFEEENRSYFEKIVPSRGDGYYDLEYINRIISNIQSDMIDDRYRLYVIVDEKSEEIVGRINIYNIVGGVFNKAEIGYRIAESHCGKGIATDAVKWALGVAKDDLNLHRLEAGCAVENIGSQIVLIKNGFQFVGRTHQIIKVGGCWQDGFNFEKLL